MFWVDVHGFCCHRWLLRFLGSGQSATRDHESKDYAAAGAIQIRVPCAATGPWWHPAQAAIVGQVWFHVNDDVHGQCCYRGVIENMRVEIQELCWANPAHHCTFSFAGHWSRKTGLSPHWRAVPSSFVLRRDGPAPHQRSERTGLCGIGLGELTVSCLSGAVPVVEHPRSRHPYGCDPYEGEWCIATSQGCMQEIETIS